MKTLSATETRTHLESVIIDVMRGETVVITDDETGEPLARFEPYGSKKARDAVLVEIEGTLVPK